MKRVYFKLFVLSLGLMASLSIKVNAQITVPVSYPSTMATTPSPTYLDLFPINHYYHIAFETIIQQSWIDQAGEIQSLSLYLLENDQHFSTMEPEIQIYMRHTDDDGYGGVTTDPIGATKWADYEKVFDGTFTFTQFAGQWKTITLQNAFEYNNIDNLEILFVDNDNNATGFNPANWYLHWGRHLIGHSSNHPSREYDVVATPFDQTSTFTGQSDYGLAMQFVIDPNPLPITLKHFTARAQNDAVRLDWASYSESNNERYVVERSLDGEHFEVIGEVMGAGNSNQTLNYHLYDRSPEQGMNYYRLKQIDFDGKFEYFDIRSVEFNSVDGHLQLQGNPVENKLKYYINRKNHGEVTVQLTDINGKLISQNKVTTTQKQTYQSIDVSSLNQGMYFLQLIVQGKVVDVEKVVVN